MQALCLMLSVTYYAQNYAQNYAGIIGWSLHVVHTAIVVPCSHNISREKKFNFTDFEILDLASYYKVLSLG